MRSDRKGAMAVMAALLLSAIMGAVAVSVDYSRLQFMRTQLRTSADAGALAGALQLTRTHTELYGVAADSVALENLVNKAAPTVALSDITCGVWHDDTSTMTDSGAACAPSTANAVKVTARVPANYLLAGRLFGTAGGTLKVTSVAWAGGSIASTRCMKPWAMPYAAILARLGQNTANTGYQMTTTDVTTLMQSTQANALTFKIGPGTQATSASGQTIPGNFYSVDLPVVQYADGTRGDPNNGANAYADVIAGCDTSTVSVGDWLKVENGNMQGPTQSPLASICGANAQAKVFDCNVRIKVAIWDTYSTTVANPGAVQVKYVGAFVITHYDGTSSPTAGVSGYFTGWPSTGKFVPRPGPVMKVVLVK